MAAILEKWRVLVLRIIELIEILIIWSEEWDLIGLARLLAVDRLIVCARNLRQVLRTLIHVGLFRIGIFQTKTVQVLLH